MNTRNKKSGRSMLAITLAVACLAVQSGMPAEAQTPPTTACAWPIAWSPYGMGNWGLPDTANRWWTMTIDATWQQLTVTGQYPKARFFSIAVYNDAPVSSGLAGRLYDANIVPDAGSGNPFAPNVTYTIKVTKSPDATGSNVLKLDKDTGYLMYRLYLPDPGDTMGDAPLPEVRVTTATGRTTVLKTCPYVNRQSEVAKLQQAWFPIELETPAMPPPVPDRMWFGVVWPTPTRLLPNPDNKYLTSFMMPAYEQDRVIVVRGKGPGFPDTYRSSSVWDPAPGFDAVQLRFWSICLADFVSPLPSEGCAVDASTPLDRLGFYTIVISDDTLRPAWLPAQAVWLPWGDRQMVPKTMLVRQLVSSPDFRNSAEEAINQGCGVPFTLSTPPTQQEILTSGKCAQQVMGDYYPIAVWCDLDRFKAGGWRACFRAAGVK
jgi:hypothetical protein